MNCEEFKDRIYLYEELTASEKTLMDDHQSQCEACNKLAVQYFQSQALIRKARALKADAKNPYQLTQRIMNSIAKEKEVSLLDQLVSYLDNLFVRYAFGVASLCLVAFFLYEQQTIDRIYSINKVTKTEIKPGPVLDMNIFLNHYRKQRVNKEPVPISRYAYYKSARSVKTYNQ
jgi:DNA repair exonuclease SbcCD ATPase subunit